MRTTRCGPAMRRCACRRRVKHYAAEVQRTQGVPIHIRVGLNAGEVVVRAIGSDLHMDYTAVGQTTHLAARMEQMAMPGSILITAAVLALAEGFIEVKPLGPVPVKGLAAPVEVYEVVDVGLVRTRLQAAVARGLTRFVGRARELDTLHAGPGTGWRRTRPGGGAGGRGRRGEVAPRLRVPARPAHPGLAQCSPAARCPMARRLPTCRCLTCSKAIAVSTAAMTCGASARRWWVKCWGSMRRCARPCPPSWRSWRCRWTSRSGRPSIPPNAGSARLDAIKRLLLRESQVQPLLLVFEDLHWIDTETQALLDSLVESLPTAQLLLLVNYRPEYQHGWGSKTYYTQLRLDPLPPVSAQALLQALLGDDASLAPLTTAVDRPHRGQSVLSGRERAHAGGDGSPGRSTGGVSSGAVARRLARACDGAGGAGGTH